MTSSVLAAPAVLARLRDGSDNDTMQANVTRKAISAENSHAALSRQSECSVQVCRAEISPKPRPHYLIISGRFSGRAE